MSRSGAGDVDADAGGDEVLSLYTGRLIRQAWRLLGDPEDARDVAQDTLLRLWQQDRARLEGHLPQWLSTVCRNRAIDVRRRLSRFEPLPEGPWQEPRSSEPSAARLVESRERLAAVRRVCARLPSSQQRVLMLRFDAGLSYREISAATGWTVSHVGVLLHAALGTIRRRLRGRS